MPGSSFFRGCWAQSGHGQVDQPQGLCFGVGSLAPPPLSDTGLLLICTPHRALKNLKGMLPHSMAPTPFKNRESQEAREEEGVDRMVPGRTPTTRGTALPAPSLCRVFIRPPSLMTPQITPQSQVCAKKTSYKVPEVSRRSKSCQISSINVYLSRRQTTKFRIYSGVNY